MKNKNLQEILSVISTESGISFEGKEVQDYDYRRTYVIRDSTLTLGTGYKIYIHFLNARIHVSIEFESVSRNILGASFERLSGNYNNILEFTRLNNFIRDFDLTINNSIYKDDSWLEFSKNSISDLRFSIYSGLVDLENEFETLNKAFNFITPFLFLVFPYQEVKTGEIEGKVQEITSNKYERSKKNRSICLAFYGYDCQGCGINLEHKYGSIASRFIHVHHITPVSVSGEHVVDPIKDLIPLCPNCHSIVHLESPPVEITKLHQITGYEK